MILEGKSYFVLLDPAAGDDSKDSNAKKPGRRGRAIVLIAVAAGGTAAGVLIPLALRHQ
jgi:hypothetical protein